MINLNKKQLKYSKKIVKEIIKNSNDYETVQIQMQNYFTMLTDISNPRFEEFNKTYKLTELANSKIKDLKPIELKADQVVVVEIIFFDKAPNGFVIATNLFNVVGVNTRQQRVDLFIKEN